MMKEVTVTYGNGSLTISPSEIDYSPGDWVVWTFLNIPPGSFGYLRFDNAPALGPFHSLRAPSNDVVIGKGNIGTNEDESTFTYDAMLLTRQVTPEEDGLLAVSLKKGSVLQTRALPDTTPDVVVTFKGKGQLLDVQPSPLRLNTGDTATWHFEGFPDGYFATLQFDMPEQPPAHPFSDFYVIAPQPGQPTGRFQANGIGFGTNVALKVGESLSYHIQVRDSLGQIASNDDPLIDNLGPPIPD